MAGYEDLSKEQLINRIKELENVVKTFQASVPEDSFCCKVSNRQEEDIRFEVAHCSKILNALPDMLSVFDYNGNYIALASAEETVHVGNSSADLIGKNLIEILPSEHTQPLKRILIRQSLARRPPVHSIHWMYTESRNFLKTVLSPWIIGISSVFAAIYPTRSKPRMNCK